MYLLCVCSFNMMLIYYTKHFDKLKQLIIQICNDTSARKVSGVCSGIVTVWIV